MALTKVTTGGITDATIATADIADDAVTAAKLASGAADLLVDTSPQLGGNLDTNDHHILVDDNHYVYYGDSEDLKIGHDGTNSYLQNTTGVLYINNTTGSASNLIVKANDNIELQPANGETGVKAIANGAVELYHNNNKKLETQSDGITCQAEVVTFQSTADVDLILNADTDNSDESHVPTIKFKSDGGTTKLKIGVEGSAGDTFTGSETNTPYILNELNANIQIGTNNTARWTFTNGGHFYPHANNSYDIGSSSQRVRNIYTNDLHLSNKGHSNDVDGTWGDWTIQEGESDLFLKNNRSGKKYKFNLTEVS